MDLFKLTIIFNKKQLSNATFISKELNITKAAISKIITKLLDKRLIKRNRLENKNISHHENLTEKTNEKLNKILNNIQRAKENFSKTTNEMDIILTKFDELKKITD
ncbi:marR family protein [Clostridium sporogenes]|uniref:MarR family transcriptional regulator n=1 Tax=Clostridium TaxID=1485 RepID=UPI00090B3C4D|nr:MULTISPECIES: MarR family transcriptional regulator [Clostridium]APF27049.1 marR family protein [Clostridium sporogenes]MDI6920651.1 MarR family transcriptional regulator [Clostridium botulinum]WMU97640.1 MarR family transcriptional regulator [Clostridium botulinum]